MRLCVTALAVAAALNTASGTSAPTTSAPVTAAPTPATTAAPITSAPTAATSPYAPFGTLKIGGLFPTSGRDCVLGVHARWAAHVAEAALNCQSEVKFKGTSDGYKIDPIIQDALCAKLARADVGTFINQPRISTSPMNVSIDFQDTGSNMSQALYLTDRFMVRLPPFP